MSNVSDLKKQLLKGPEFKAAYESMSDEFALASAVIEARSAAGLTQETSIKMRQGIAEATGTHLKLSLEQLTK